MWNSIAPNVTTDFVNRYTFGEHSPRCRGRSFHMVTDWPTPWNNCQVTSWLIFLIQLNVLYNKVILLFCKREGLTVNPPDHLSCLIISNWCCEYGKFFKNQHHLRLSKCCVVVIFIVNKCPIDLNYCLHHLCSPLFFKLYSYLFFIHILVIWTQIQCENLHE